MGDQNFLDQFISLYDNKTTINICSTGLPVRKKTITTEISSHYHNFVGTVILPDYTFDKMYFVICWNIWKIIGRVKRKQVK